MTSRGQRIVRISELLFKLDSEDWLLINKKYRQSTGKLITSSVIEAMSIEELDLMITWVGNKGFTNEEVVLYNIKKEIGL